MNRLVEPGVVASVPAVKLAGIRKSYHMGSARIDALRGVDLDIGAGEILAITGPSGSGKSTLLNVIGLIDAPDAGQCAIEGRDTVKLAEDARTQLRRVAIGFIFQSFNLVPVMSAYENVEYPLFLLGVPANERRQRVTAALAAVGIEGFARHKPDRLSGGQRQRAAIARAVVKNPRLVIADEPTANLDSETAAQIVALMQTLSREQGTAFVIATHDERMTAHCDRVLRLTDGVLQ